ncbi:MAG: ATP-binding cassette domain-containing protein [Anaerolineales bacterium]|jgi:ABC-2 type transport system ATP-binding protein
MKDETMYAVETKDLTRFFGKVLAVDGLNLKVAQGSLFGLIGPNGAGKTTTLRMLAGLLEPSEGEILLNGEALNGNWRALHTKIGFMPDFFGVYEDMLVWEYLDFFARCYNLPAERRKRVVDELLELVDLARKRDAYVQSLSRGMRQRLCLAHALVQDPQVLLLDEPASGLDPRARVEMRELLRELGAMGKTILLSSHILTELADMCSEIAIIEQGRIVASGPLAEISQQAGSQRTLHIRVLNNVDSAGVVLRNLPGVGQVFVESDSSLEVEFNGDDDAAAELLHHLVYAGVRVAAFNESSSNLEEIFLRLTRGEVA